MTTLADIKKTAENTVADFREIHVVHGLHFDQIVEKVTQALIAAEIRGMNEASKIADECNKCDYIGRHEIVPTIIMEIEEVIKGIGVE